MGKTDLISRAAVIDAIVSMTSLPDVDSIKSIYNIGNGEEWVDGVYDAINAVEDVNAVDAVPVVHARWKDNGNETVSCSRCATWFPKEREPYMLYCGCCGARMDGERRDSE